MDLLDAPWCELIEWTVDWNDLESHHLSSLIISKNCLMEHYFWEDANKYKMKIMKISIK